MSLLKHRMNIQLFANASGTGTTWNLPNYSGELFTADSTNTPILSAIGGLTGGVQTENYEFATDSQYAYPSATQPEISEQASLTAPSAIAYARSQGTNLTQIFHEKVSVSYVKQSNGGRMSGLNTAGQRNNAPSEKDFQIARALGKIARDIEYTLINGVYKKSTAVDVANKTRGMLEVCAGLNNVDNSVPAELSKAMIDALLKEMYDNGAIFSNLVFG